MRKILSVTLLSLVAMASAANAKSGVKVGVLSCGVEGGVGFIIGSSKAVDCVYQPASGSTAGTLFRLDWQAWTRYRGHQSSGVGLGRICARQDKQGRR